MNKVLSDWRVQFLRNQEFNFKIENYSHIKEFYNPNCGDKCEVFLVIKENKVSEISYSLHGCGIQTAALELVCKSIKGNPIQEVEKIKEELLELEVESNRKHCLVFVEEICDWIIESLK